MKCTIPRGSRWPTSRLATDGGPRPVQQAKARAHTHNRKRAHTWHFVSEAQSYYYKNNHLGTAAASRCSLQQHAGSARWWFVLCEPSTFCFRRHSSRPPAPIRLHTAGIGFYSIFLPPRGVVWRACVATEVLWRGGELWCGQLCLWRPRLATQHLQRQRQRPKPRCHPPRNPAPKGVLFGEFSAGWVLGCGFWSDVWLSAVGVPANLAESGLRARMRK